MSYRPRYNNNGTLEDLPIDAETVKGHEMESTGIASNTDTIPTTAQVKSYVDDNEKYHIPTATSGVKIATGMGTGALDMYVPTGTAAGTVCVGNDTRLSNSRTPKSHASSSTTYGVGTSANYGHVKVISGDLNGKSATNGYAASQSHSHSNYQDKLVSGTNIKTINNQSLLGSGNISVSGGSSKYHHCTKVFKESTCDVYIHWWSETQSTPLSGTTKEKASALYDVINNINGTDFYGSSMAMGWCQNGNRKGGVIYVNAYEEDDDYTVTDYIEFSFIIVTSTSVSSITNFRFDKDYPDTGLTITDKIIP